jgi:hypothetical protein
VTTGKNCGLSTRALSRTSHHFRRDISPDEDAGGSNKGQGGDGGFAGSRANIRDFRRGNGVRDEKPGPATSEAVVGQHINFLPDRGMQTRREFCHQFSLFGRS